MKEKTARRFLNRNKFGIAKLNIGGLKRGGQFHKQYSLCKKIVAKKGK